MSDRQKLETRIDRILGNVRVTRDEDTLGKPITCLRGIGDDFRMGREWSSQSDWPRKDGRVWRPNGVWNSRVVNFLRPTKNWPFMQGLFPIRSLNNAKSCTVPSLRPRF